MSQQQEFLFVNADNASKGHKISTSGRAFVIRKARAAQGWSTKSKTKQNATRGPANAAGTSSKPISTSKTGVSSSSPSDRVPTSIKTTPTINDTTPLTPDPDLDPDQASDQSSHDRLAKRDKCDYCLIPVPTGRFNNPIDPFRAMSLDLDDRDTSLLAYYHVANNSLAPRITLLDNGSQSLEAHQYWATMSLEHPGFMHGVLCISAVKLALVQPNRAAELVDRFMYHRIQAMASIQRNLADSRLALSDENMASVFNLVCTEEVLALESSLGLAHNPTWALLEPDRVQREAHVVGWRRMLAMRGGVAGLGDALQSFVFRWGYSALSNLMMSMYSRPHLYRSPHLTPPGVTSQLYQDPNHTTYPTSQVVSDKTNFAVSRFLPAYRSLPQNILARFHRYPELSPFARINSQMAEACSRVGMHPELIKHITTTNCMIRDGMAWLADNRQYSWNSFHLQNMFATGIGELVRWIYENEATMSAAESVTVLTLFTFLLLSCDGQHSICCPLPGIIPRLRWHIQEPTVRPVLQDAGIDTWVALVLLIATKDTRERNKEFFLQYYLDTLADKSPPITTFEALLDTVRGCLWTPAMNLRARKAWNAARTHSEWERLRAAIGSGPLNSIFGTPQDEAIVEALDTRQEHTY